MIRLRRRFGWLAVLAPALTILLLWAPLTAEIKPLSPGGGGGVSAAVDLTVTPAGAIAATNAQAALEELDTEKVAAGSITAADVGPGTFPGGGLYTLPLPNVAGENFKVSFANGHFTVFGRGMGETEFGASLFANVGPSAVLYNGSTPVFRVAAPATYYIDLGCIASGCGIVPGSGLALLLGSGNSWAAEISTDGTMYFGGTKLSATPRSVSLNGQGSSGTDVAGASLSIAGGKGTGTGKPGSTGFQTSYKLGTGTTLQSLRDRDKVFGGAIDLTESSATAVFTSLGVASGSIAGGTWKYTIEANDGTDYQAIRGSLEFAVVNKAGVLTCTLGTPVEITVTSAGTLTDTPTCTTGANVITLNINAVSSLTQTTLRATSRLLLDGGTGLVTE